MPAAGINAPARRRPPPHSTRSGKRSPARCSPRSAPTFKDERSGPDPTLQLENGWTGPGCVLRAGRFAASSGGGFFLMPSNIYPHPEERPEGASRRTRDVDAAPAFDAVIVGAGFAGMYMLHRLRGMGFS